MTTFNVPTKADVTPEAQAIFDNLEKGLGMVPNLYAYIGNSANALGSYLQFSQAQAKGTFSSKEREAIFLAVSQENGCEYCQAAHTYLGKANGFSEEETIAIRVGNHGDKKIDIITRLAADIQHTKGYPSRELLEDFFALGYSHTALVDLIALVADKVFMNYIHNITKVPVDFPSAPVLATQEV
ncbi:MAG: carboxymuconolactone decarboxylase family protein [Flavipsychrobacter sp.]